MIQINLLFIHLDVHLHRDQFEIFCIILPQVLHVMITGYEIDFPIQSFEYLCPFSRATKTEVAKMKYDIIRTDHTVPVGNKCFIHVFYILEWPATEPDDIGMIEVGIGCKEHPASVEFVIYNLLFLCTSLRWLIKLKFSMPMDGNDGVERIMRTSPMGKNKAVEKFSKDFSTASIYLFNRNTRT